MRIRRILFKLTLAALLGLAPTLAAAQEPLTSDQRRALGDAEADRLIRKELLSILRPLPDGFGGGNRRRIGDQTLFTRSYGTAYANLCRTDLLTLRYAPTDGGERHENSPIAAYGLSSESWYHLSAAPRPRSEVGGRRQVWDDDCARLAPETYVGWFSAPSEQDVVLAANVLKVAVAQVRAGTLKPGPCDDLFDAKKSCADLVLEEADFERVSQIEACDAPVGRLCYRIDFSWQTGMTIVFTRPGGALEPTAVESLKVHQYVIIT